MLKNLPNEYKTNILSVEHLIFSIMYTEDCDAYGILNEILLEETLRDMKVYCDILFNDQPYDEDAGISLSDSVTNILNMIDDEMISSTVVLIKILEESESARKVFERNGADLNNVLYSLRMSLSDSKTANDEVPFKHKKKPVNKVKKTSQTTFQKTTQQDNSNNSVETHLSNLNKLSEEGKIDEVFGNDKIYYEIFNVFSKRTKNNVLITGPEGCGKTATVKNIANMLTSGNVLEPFKNKVLVQMDFTKLASDVPFKGGFDLKLDAIISDAKKSGDYIFFIDDINTILNDKARFSDVDTSTLLIKILSERSIQFIATCSDKGYKSSIEDNPSLSRMFQRIQMESPSISESVNLLNKIKSNYELYHRVKYSESTIVDAVKLSDRYITTKNLPDSAIDIIDEAGAMVSINKKKPENIQVLEFELDVIMVEKENLDKNDKDYYQKFDELTKNEISVKSKLKKAQKDSLLNSAPVEVTMDDIREVISNKIKMPLSSVTSSDKNSLRHLDKRLKSVVVGQDDAVDAITKVIKRQRIGLSNPNKPAVFLCVGATGSGKTHLSKSIAKELFGDVNKLVRFDMSEYSDKTSVNKLIGSSSGYIGYENGGLLTEAVKKYKHCVLLFDEIEKASTEVHNLFLQLFDEGDLTDNKGVRVDFKNTIIMMTSNVGAKKIGEFGRGVGFTRNSEENSNTILDKELKKTFRPEFLNRIDSVVCFNILSDENLKDIIKLEITKVMKQIDGIGYSVDDSFLSDEFVNKIFNNVSDKKQFGARPIIRELQNNFTDKITDYILSHDIPDGFVFNVKHLET